MHTNRSVLPMVFIGVAIIMFVLTIFTGNLVLGSGLLLSVVALLFFHWSFRDPERHAPRGDDLILSAADGRVCSLERVKEYLFLEGEGIAVGSICHYSMCMSTGILPQGLLDFSYINQENSFPPLEKNPPNTMNNKLSVSKMNAVEYSLNKLQVQLPDALSAVFVSEML